MSGTKIGTSSVSPVEREKLLELARRKIVLELGSWEGATTRALCEVARKVHAVDWFHGDDQAGHRGFRDLLYLYLTTVTGHENLVTHIGDFSDVLPHLRPQSFDLVFVDGHHSEESTHVSGAHALQLVKPGGTVAFHDYNMLGVETAAASLFSNLPPSERTETLAVFHV